ncbi:hypothetical protein G6F31_015288 [Rhizopus arrhizus]|nr:hypothetical protein G6F31_015288 [Rhizopus arrhizus]
MRLLAVRLGAVQADGQQVQHRQAGHGVLGLLVDIALQHVGVQHADILAARGGHVGQRPVAVAAGGVEAQHEQLVRARSVQRQPVAAGGVTHFDVRQTTALGLRGVHVPAQAAGVRVRARRAAGAVDSLHAVFQHALDLGARDLQAPEHVAERNHFDHIGRRHVAQQGHAHAAAALQRDVRAAVGGVGHVQIGLRHQLLNVAAAQADAAQSVARRARTAVVARTRAARHAARAQFLRHRGDQAGAEGVDLCLERLQHACGLRVRLLDAQETAGSHIGQDGGLVRGGGRGAGHRERVAPQHLTVSSPPSGE